MKTLSFFSMAALVLAMVACSKEVAPVEEPVQEGKIHFTATLANPVTKTAYTENTTDKTISVAWEENDEFALIYNAKKYDGLKVTDVSETGSATISGDLIGITIDDIDSDGESVTLVYPASIVTESGLIDDTAFLSQDGTLKSIADNLDWRQCNATLVVSENEATLSSSVKLESQIAIWKLTLRNSESTLAPNQVTIKDDNGFVAATKVITIPAEKEDKGVYMAVPAKALSNLTIKAVADGKLYTYTPTNSEEDVTLDVPLEASTYYQSTVTMEQKADGVLPGLFSVSATQKIYFAKGNLTYSDTAPNWRFLNNSWTYNTYPSKFNKNDGSQHFEWETIFSGEDTMLTEITTAMESTGWNALSYAEWLYLLGWDNEANPNEQASKREAEHRFAKITVSGDTDLASLSTGNRRYLLIFPDSFTVESDWTEAMGPKPTAYDGNGESTMPYTVGHFTAMQNAGIVILPAAGDRDTSKKFGNVGSGGRYWSSTPQDANTCYHLYFNIGYVCMGSYNKTNYYYSVRLVQNVE